LRALEAIFPFDTAFDPFQQISNPHTKVHEAFAPRVKICFDPIMPAGNAIFAVKAADHIVQPVMRQEPGKRVLLYCRSVHSILIEKKPIHGFRNWDFRNAVF
jgi:hypothetical protein